MNQNFPRIAGSLAAILLIAAPIPTSGAARRGPPEGSSTWTRSQQLLERPAAALRGVIDARERGDRLRAEWLLAEIALRYPVIRDHADRMRAEILLELDRPADVLGVVVDSMERDPETGLTAQLRMLEGRAHSRLGREAEARGAWRKALDASRDASLRARLLLLTAESEEREGLSEEAIQTYRVLWHLYPAELEAETASARLDAREAGGKPLRTAEDWRRRADSLYRARQNPEALAAYEKALATGLSRADARRARLRRAQTLFRLRRYPEAVEAFAALPQTDDIPIWHARSLARADRVPEAIAAFEHIAKQRRGHHALRARFLAALLLDGRDETEKSTRYLKSLVDTGRRSSVRRASLWRLGWRAYREGRWSDAIARIDDLLDEESDPIGRLRSRYWRTRALEQLGTEEAANQARTAYAEMAAAYPLTYYGWRARTRLPAAERAALVATEEGLPPPDPGKRRIQPDQLTRARILIEAGLPDLALDELARAARQVGGLADRLELAQLFRSAGNFRRAQRLVLDPYKEELARAPEPTLEELWWHAWPAAFLELVEEATEAPGSVDAALVFSIMREESGFRPKVVSPVGARGLLQIMEPTGRRLAAAVGHEGFSPDDLFEPRTNIRLGAHYLGELTARFDGRLSAAIASYNAGPEAVSRWLDERGGMPDDEWVESIPYEQTRSYVKRVLRSLQAYQLLY